MTSPVDLARLRTLNTLLAELLDLPAEARENWLATREGPARELVTELRAMLAQADESFLAKGVEVPGELLGSRAEREGDLVGPYRLLRPLGEGGMATVWLAERADGTMQRQVALKLPRLAWARGLAQRMARERDILAGLEHPHIARLYDAGLTEEGRPWLAMEFVDGRPIDRWCAERQADVATRLSLFLQVGEAVSHAHGRLVVHRDLKPSNILVTGGGSVRLLDFGVAKLLEGEEGREPALTQLLGRALTPDYASPEQVRGEPLGAASDVYSLGVVLYELLTGQRPYRLKRDTPAALEEAVLDAEIPAASSRAADRRAARRLRGDLDAILDKALRKRPAARYASVEAFAQDIRRHLRGEPVLAQPPSFAYRAGKFVTRHRWPLLAVTAIVGALAAGLAIAFGEAREAERQRQHAIEQARQTESALEFASAVITEGIRGGERLTREELVERAGRQALSAGSDADRLTAADTVSGWYSSLGRHRASEAMLREVLGATRPEAAPALHRILQCRHGAALASLGRVDEGVAMLMRVIDEPGAADEVSRYCLQRRALVARYAGDGEGALRFALRAREAYARANYSSVIARGLLEGELGFAYSLVGRPADADRHYAEAAKQFESGGRGGSIQAVTVLNNWAIALISMGNHAEALALLDRARGNAARLVGEENVPPYLVSNRAQALLVLARLDEAEAAYRGLKAAAVAAGDGNFEVAAHAGLAEVLLVRRDAEGARAQIEAGERVVADRKLKPGVAPVRRLNTVKVAWLIERGELDAALALVDSVLAEFERSGVRVGQVSVPLRQRSLIHARQGRAAEALADAERSLVVARDTQGAKPHSNFTGAAWLAIARLRREAGQEAEAREAAAEARAHLVATMGEAHPLTRIAIAFPTQGGAAARR